MAPIQSVEGEKLACVRGGRLVLCDVNFRVASGEILQVEGANGSGKTSLLRLIAGLLAPAGGTIRLDAAPDDDAETRRKSVGWLGHQDGAKAQLTSRQALSFFAQLYGRSPALPLREGRTISPAFHAGDSVRGGVSPRTVQPDPSPKFRSREISTLPQAEGGFNFAHHVEAALAEVGLQRAADLPCQYLSAGQKRRLALARLKLCGRPLWLLDEPLAALDAQGRSLIADMLRAHANAGGIAIAATHEPLGLDAARLHLA